MKSYQIRLSGYENLVAYVIAGGYISAGVTSYWRYISELLNLHLQVSDRVEGTNY